MKTEKNAISGIHVGTGVVGSGLGTGVGHGVPNELPELMDQSPPWEETELESASTWVGTTEQSLFVSMQVWKREKKTVGKEFFFQKKSRFA